jgi:carboxyl-terminal processing protease
MRGWRILFVALISLWTSSEAGRAWGDIPDQPPMRNRQVAFYVNFFLTGQHLSRHPLDNEISNRLLKEYVEGLDPAKAYFLQSDIDEFQKQKDELDDQLKKLDTHFALDVFRVLNQRVEQRVKWVEEFLSQNIDFTVDEEFNVDPDQRAYAKDEADAKEQWRKRVKFDLLELNGTEGIDSTNGPKAHEAMLKRYQGILHRLQQTDADELLERYMNALTSTYDPHSTYFSPGSYEDFRIRLALNYEGIGAELEERDGSAIIRSVIPGGAAAKAGQFKVKDRIVSVGQGEEGQMVDVMNMKLDNIIDLIRGREGTVVRLGVIPEGTPDVQTYKITRARIELKDSEARAEVFDQGNKPDGSPYKVGFINLPSFYLDMDAARHGNENYKNSTDDVKRILNEFNQTGVDAVILDLRGNGGGSLTEAIGVTGLFIDKGPVVQVKDAAGKVEVQSDEDSGAVWKGPLVVVTDRFSASASEILAGALQDYGRALIVGDESTHGKGTVQSLLEVGPTVMKFENAINLGAIKITMQQFYRPNGDSTQSRGVVADVALPSLRTRISKGESELDYALAFDHVKEADFQHVANLVSPDLIAKLKEASEKRRKESADFTKLDETIRRYDEDKARKTMPLNEQKFLELRAQANSEKSEREEFEKFDHANQESIKRDFYVNELLAITGDYLTQLHGATLASN